MPSGLARSVFSVPQRTNELSSLVEIWGADPCSRGQKDPTPPTPKGGQDRTGKIKRLSWGDPRTGLGLRDLVRSAQTPTVSLKLPQTERLLGMQAGDFQVAGVNLTRQMSQIGLGWDLRVINLFYVYLRKALMVEHIDGALRSEIAKATGPFSCSTDKDGPGGRMVIRGAVLDTSRHFN